MDTARHKLLAGTGFSLDKDSRIGRGHYSDVSQNRLKRRTFANHVSNTLIGLDFVAQVRVHTVPDGIQQGFIIDRLRQKVCRACFDRADSHRYVPVAREKHDRDWRARLGEPLLEVESV